MPKQKRKKKQAVKKKTALGGQKKAVKRKKIVKKTASTKRERIRKQVKKKASDEKTRQDHFGRRIPVKILADDKKEDLKSSLPPHVFEPEPKSYQEFSAEPELKITEENKIAEFKNENFDVEESAGDNLAELQSEASRDIEEEYIYSRDMTRRQKTYLMYVAVGCIMAVIFTFWFLAIKNSLGQLIVSQDAKEESQNIREIKSYLGEIREDFGQIDNLINEEIEVFGDFEIKAKSKIIETRIKDDIADRIKEELEKSPSENIESINNNLDINQ